MFRTHCMATTALMVAGMFSLSCLADDPMPVLPGYVTQSVIDGNAMSDVRGRFVANVAAGDSNAQIAAGALAIGVDGGSAVAQIGALQAVGSIHATAPDLSIAIIGGQAFTNSVGAISVNQTSGVGNTQANGMAIAMGVGVEAVSESVLAATTSGVGLVGNGAGAGVKAASIADTAFEGSRGLIQINQSAGSGNSTANNFALQVTAK